MTPEEIRTFSKLAKGETDELALLEMQVGALCEIALQLAIRNEQHAALQEINRELLAISREGLKNVDKPLTVIHTMADPTDDGAPPASSPATQ